MLESEKYSCDENITSAITPYQLVGDIQGIKEALWYLNNKCKKYSLARLRDRMCFLMTKCGILCGESFFGVNYQTLGCFRKIDEEPHPLHCVFMTILQGWGVLT